MRSTPLAISWILLFASLYFISFIVTVEGKAAWLCRPCPDENPDCLERPPVEFCLWGEARNPCKQRVCAKGPGERCGGRKNIFGTCGDGMWCQQEKEKNLATCHGCYRYNSAECYNEE